MDLWKTRVTRRSSLGRGSAMTWIFDPKTHLYLGTPEQTSRTAVVSQAGARP